MIPKKIYFTHEDISNLKPVLNTINNNKKNNPNYQFLFYNKLDRFNFIKDNYLEFLEYYERINDNYGAMKADIFRILILHKYGGIYIDHKVSIENLDKLLFDGKNDYDFYTCDTSSFHKINQFVLNRFKCKYSNFFIATVKEGKIITQIKDELLERLKNFDNIQKKILKKGIIGVYNLSGPKLVSSILLKKENEGLFFNISTIDSLLVYDNTNYIMINFKKIINRKNTYHFNKLPLLKSID
jgi:mannosyltransferase OCH1-like enzyme